MTAFRPSWRATRTTSTPTSTSGSCSRTTGKLDEAHEHLKRAQRLRSRDVAVLYALGALHLAAGRAGGGAQGAGDRDRERAPTYRQAHVLLATAYYRLKDKEKGDRRAGPRREAAGGGAGAGARARWTSWRPPSRRRRRARGRSRERVPRGRAAGRRGRGRAAARSRARRSKPKPDRASAPRRVLRPALREAAEARAARAARRGGRALRDGPWRCSPAWVEGRSALATLLFDLKRYAEARDHFAEAHGRAAAGRRLAWALLGLCDVAPGGLRRGAGRAADARARWASRAPRCARWRRSRRRCC